MDELILCAIDNGVCRLTLNRPEKLNALTAESLRQISGHLDRLNIDDIACVLITGSGSSFCAGHDLDDLAADVTSSTKHFESQVIERLATLPIPVVAAIRGYCYTGGLEFALAADIIIAAESAKFGDTHAKWDLVPLWGLSQRLPRRVGVSKAKEMMFASRTYSGAEAEAMGLANFCVPDESFDAEVERFCRDVAANSTRSVRALKKLIADTDTMPLAAGIGWELHRSEGHGPGSLERIASRRAK